MEFSDFGGDISANDPSREELERLCESLKSASADEIRGHTSMETVEELVHYCIEQEKYADALRFADIILGFYPFSGEIWQRRGIALSELGQHQEARESFAKALAFNPADEETLIHLGAALSNASAYDEALTALEQALTMAP